ncbi:hypothetical protein NPX13_g5796 [Xylaria arbuscula]|uniref:PD-(D/E)XK nuclease-like domain-containing protein n=1 Tax=Xylaria arbuscula TaxID=114810 RepID=A0A9W8NDR8_9PEZI|nr:hypothetical protein NPX13_g5796 [Xylaria arbuscula]
MAPPNVQNSAPCVPGCATPLPLQRPPQNDGEYTTTPLDKSYCWTPQKAKETIELRMQQRGPASTDLWNTIYTVMREGYLPVPIYTTLVNQVMGENCPVWDTQYNNPHQYRNLLAPDTRSLLQINAYATQPLPFFPHNPSEDDSNKRLEFHAAELAILRSIVSSTKNLNNADIVEEVTWHEKIYRLLLDLAVAAVPGVEVKNGTTSPDFAVHSTRPGPSRHKNSCLALPATGYVLNLSSANQRSGLEKVSPPILPIVRVNGAEWGLYFADSASDLFGPIIIGSTYDLEDAYRLLGILKTLATWMATHFQGWVQSCLGEGPRNDQCHCKRKRKSGDA